MAKCPITSRTKAFGNKVSHACNRSRRTFKLNVHTTHIKINNRKVKLKMSVRGMRTLKKRLAAADAQAQIDNNQPTGLNG